MVMYWIQFQMRLYWSWYSMAAFSPKCMIKMVNPLSDIKYVTSCRNNFIQFNSNYECRLFNPDWGIHPSTDFFKGIRTTMLTYCNHDNENKWWMINPCWQQCHILPLSMLDQLCYAIIKSGTIKLLKASTYSNTFQIYEQQGTFNGICTCSVINMRYLNFCSLLLHGSE